MSIEREVLHNEMKQWIRENMRIRVRKEGAGFSSTSQYLTVELCLLDITAPDWDEERFEVISTDEVLIGE